MAIKQGSEIRILSNRDDFPQENNLIKFSDYDGNQFDRLDISNFFLRDAYIEENIIYKIALGINSKGQVLDADNDYAALPCPPYCDVKEDDTSKIIRISDTRRERVEFIISQCAINPVPEGFTLDELNQVRYQRGSVGLLCVTVNVVKNDIVVPEKLTAYVGISQRGRIMDEDVHLIVVKG